MKKLIATVLLAAGAVTAAPIGSAQAVLSNCSTGTFYNSSYAVGAMSVCNSGTGTQRIRIKCYLGGGGWYTKSGPYVGVTQTSGQWCNGSDMLMDKWIQLG